jgi:hypothetical protein
VDHHRLIAECQHCTRSRPHRRQPCGVPGKAHARKQHGAARLRRFGAVETGVRRKSACPLARRHPEHPGFIVADGHEQHLRFAHAQRE